MEPRHVTRLAPSPTGSLHLGNARTFLLNWLLARQRGWGVVFRMEDLDGPRVKADAVREAIEQLLWLGLDWEGEVVCQSARTEAYAAALRRLIETGAAYPCTCSRRDIAKASSAPAEEDGVSAYRGTCRELYASAEQAEARSGRPPAWRVRVDDAPVAFRDAFAGEQSFDLSRVCGDFVVFRSCGLAAYQLAVVVDDHAAGVDTVVRADDLLGSAAMQIHLRRLLGLGSKVGYLHLPLVVGTDGRKLAKRHGDTTLASYIRGGTSRRRMLGLLGYWSGTLARREETDINFLLEKFDIDSVPHQPIVFTKQDDAFLKGK